MRPSALLALTLAVVTAAATTAHGQQRQPPVTVERGKSETAPSQTPAQAPAAAADPLCADLASVKETSVAALFERAKRDNLSKDEFETTPEFLARVKQSGDATVAFVVALGPAFVSYNADERRLRMSTGPVSLPLHAGGTGSVRLMNNQRIVATYDTRTVMGVPFTATRIESETYTATLLALPTSAPLTATDPGQHTMTAERGPARDLKTSAGILIVGDIISPGYKETRGRTVPSLDQPVEDHYINKALTIRTRCAAFVNVATRQVLKRIK